MIQPYKTQRNSFNYHILMKGVRSFKSGIANNFFIQRPWGMVEMK